MSTNARDLFDPTQSGGKERSDALPPTWPGPDPRDGSGIAGQVFGYDSFKSDMKDEAVTVLRLEHAVEYIPNADGVGGDLIAVGEVGIIVGASLRRRVGDATLPRGSFVSLRYRGTDPSMRNMKLYDVHDVDRSYLGRLHKAAAMSNATKPARITNPPVTAQDAGHDDLPF